MSQSPGSPYPGSKPSGGLSSISLFLFKVLGRNGCPYGSPSLSLLSTWRRELESLGETGRDRGSHLSPSSGGTGFWAQTPATASWGCPQVAFLFLFLTVLF